MNITYIYLKPAMYIFSFFFFLLSAVTLPAFGSPTRNNANGWRIVDGVLVDGTKAFFPLGIYYVSHYPSEKQRRLEDLKTIANAGFTILHTPLDTGDRELLRECDRLGLQVIGEFNQDPDELAPELDGYRALRAWSTYDDVDSYRKFSTVPRYVPDAVANRTQVLHKASPRLLTYISGGFPDRLGGYAPTADLVGLQTYPVPDEVAAEVGKAWNTFKGTLPDKKNGFLIANLQLFGWHGVKRSPEGVEVRNMTYQALITGAKGILYYTFYDQVTDLRGQKELWSDLKDLVVELRAAQSFFISGNRCKFEASDPDTFAARWSLPNMELFVAVNGAAKTATVDFHGCNTSGLETLSKPAGTADSPAVQVSLQPLEVVVQQLSH